jgi:hypothetical protein
MRIGEEWEIPFEKTYTSQSIIFTENENCSIYFGRDLKGIINSFKFTGTKGDPIFEREDAIRKLILFLINFRLF